MSMSTSGGGSGGGGGSGYTESYRPDMDGKHYCTIPGLEACLLILHPACAQLLRFVTLCLAASTLSSNSELEAARPATVGEEELQLQLALAMSKEEHEEEMKKSKADDIKLQMAIEESRKEEVAQQVQQNMGGNCRQWAL